MYKFERSEDYMREWILRPDGSYLCGTDAECPEDNTLSRNGSEILGELNKLYDEIKSLKEKLSNKSWETSGDRQ